MLKNTLEKIIRRRKDIIQGLFLVFILVLGVYYLFFNKGSQNGSDNISPTPTPQVSSINSQKESTNIEKNQYDFTPKPYLLYQVNTNKSILGYGWAKNKLVYATENGIFEARDSNPIIDQKITNATFTPSGQALVKSSNGWFIFENGKTLNPVQINGSLPILDSTGSRIVSIVGNKLNVFTVSSKSTYQIDLSNTSPNALFLSKDGSIAALSGTTNNKTFIELVDLKQQKSIDQVEFDKDAVLFGISPSGEKLMIQLTNEILIRSRYNDVKDIRYQLSNNANYFGYWIDDNQAVLVEKRPKNGSYTIASLYLLNAREEKKTFLVDDKQMLNKIKPDIPLFLDSKGKAIPVVENKGTLWLVSLEQGKVANYSKNTGLSFTEFSTADHEDSY